MAKKIGMKKIEFFMPYVGNKFHDSSSESL
jgi:hypothetical protein